MTSPLGAGFDELSASKDEEAKEKAAYRNGNQRKN
jgi:hypothetical protein